MAGKADKRERTAGVTWHSEGGEAGTAGGGSRTCDWIQCVGIQNLTEMRINHETVCGKKINAQNQF